MGEIPVFSENTTNPDNVFADYRLKNPDLPIPGILLFPRIQKIFGQSMHTFCYMTDAITWILKADARGTFDVFTFGMDSTALTKLG